MLFRLEKPEGFDYHAGNHIDLILVNPPETDAEGNKRDFSLTSIPEDDHLAVATRMRDTAFKRVLKALAPGAELELKGPSGDFVLHENAARPAVFLAGGIGITPFYAMARDAAARSLPHRITLFYSNRRPEDAAFLADLMALPDQNPNFTFVSTMTEMEKSTRTWEGEQGYIDAAMLARHLTERENALYYLAGPASMVTALRKMLSESGVSPDDIRTEEFSGY